MYDPTADPVDVAALATAVLDGGTHADIDVATDTGLRRREPTTLVTGSGSTVAGASHSWPATGPVAATAVATTTVIAAGGLELVVLHVVDRHTTSDHQGRPPQPCSRTSGRCPTHPAATNQADHVSELDELAKSDTRSFGPPCETPTRRCNSRSGVSPGAVS